MFFDKNLTDNWLHSIRGERGKEREAAREIYKYAVMSVNSQFFNTIFTNSIPLKTSSKMPPNIYRLRFSVSILQADAQNLLYLILVAQEAARTSHHVSQISLVKGSVSVCLHLIQSSRKIRAVQNDNHFSVQLLKVWAISCLLDSFFFCLVRKGFNLKTDAIRFQMSAHGITSWFLHFSPVWFQIVHYLFFLSRPNQVQIDRFGWLDHLNAHTYIRIYF